MIEEIFGWITHEDPVTKELLGHHRQEPCAVCAAKEHKKSLELLAAIIDTFNLALSAWSMAEQASEATRDRCANMAFEAMEGWYEDSKDKMRREAGLANSDIHCMLATEFVGNKILNDVLSPDFEPKRFPVLRWAQVESTEDGPYLQGRIEVPEQDSRRRWVLHASPRGSRVEVLGQKSKMIFRDATLFFQENSASTEENQRIAELALFDLGVRFQLEEKSR